MQNMSHAKHTRRNRHFSEVVVRAFVLAACLAVVDGVVEGVMALRAAAVVGKPIRA